MPDNNIHAFIKTLQQGGLSLDSVDTILSRAQLVTVKIHSKLVTSGNRCQKIFFLLEGAFVSRYIDDETTQERAVSFHLANFQPFMTCIDSYFSAVSTHYELLCTSDAKVLAFNKKDLEELAASQADMSHFYYNQIIIGLMSEHNFRTKLITFSSERFFKYLRSSYPQIIQNIPSKYIAEFMGISQEWLSKLKNKH